MADENEEQTRDEADDAEPNAVHAEELDEPAEGDDDEQTAAGMRGYESEHNPGERVRVARMTDDVGAPAERDEADDDEEADDESEGGEQQFDVTVRGEGPAEPEPESLDASDSEHGAPSSGENREDEDAGERRESSPPETGETADPARDDTGPGSARDSEPALDEFETSDDIEEFEPQFEVEEPDESESATTEEFAEMFETQGVPDQKTYTSGDRVEGEILEIGDRFIFVQIDPHNEGAAKRREFEDDEGELELEVGDTAEFYVTYADEDEVQLGRQMEGDQGSIDAIREAAESGVPVEGKVTGTNKGGFDIEVHGVDAFCPISEIEIGYTDEKDVHVGATYRFKVKEVRDGGDTIVLSRAEILREEREEKARETLENLEEGDVVEGVVTRTTNFGVFVDLGGVEGLCHVSELSHRHFDHPDDVVEKGERIEVEVLEIEEPGEGEAADDQPRISLSRQATEHDPWEVVNEQFAVGEKVEGRVVRNAPFGAFIEIAPGVEGLCHVSEMSWTEHVRTPDEIVEPGEKVTVQVQDIDIPRKRVSLSLREAEGDPWDEVGETYSVGMEVEGTVENIEDFGVFVQLPTGITALLPRSEMNLPSGVTPHRKYNQGESVTAEIINIDPGERKMALAPPSGESDEEPAESEAGEAPEAPPAPSTEQDSDGSFGTLGDMIGEDLEDRD